MNRGWWRNEWIKNGDLFYTIKMNVKRTCTQRRVCIGMDKKGAACPKRRSADESLLPSNRYHRRSDLPIVLATLDVLIERANLGTILCRRKSSLLLGSKLEKPFSQLSVPLNLSQVPRLNVVIHLLILLIVFCGIDFNYSFTTKVTNWKSYYLSTSQSA